MTTSHLSLVASVLWLVVAASPAMWWLGDDHWQIGHGIFSCVDRRCFDPTRVERFVRARGWARH